MGESDPEEAPFLSTTQASGASQAQGCFSLGSQYI